jgi:hypothetical protein
LKEPSLIPDGEAVGGESVAQIFVLGDRPGERFFNIRGYAGPVARVQIGRANAVRDRDETGVYIPNRVPDGSRRLRRGAEHFGQSGGFRRVDVRDPSHRDIPPAEKGREVIVFDDLSRTDDSDANSARRREGLDHSEPLR